MCVCFYPYNTNDIVGLSAGLAVNDELITSSLASASGASLNSLMVATIVQINKLDSILQLVTVATGNVRLLDASLNILEIL